MTPFDFVNQTQLGRHFNWTSHATGRTLRHIGLRENREPTQRAKEEGYCRPRFVNNGHGDWICHRSKNHERH